MKHHPTREYTLEEFDAWMAETDKEEAVAQAADEEGGPRLSLVPVTDRDIAWPTDLLPPGPPPACLGEGDHAQHGGGGQSDAADPPQLPIEAMPFDGIPLESSRNRLAGWSAERQKLFLTVLAETGQVHLAAAAARLSVRSAQALRVRTESREIGRAHV